MGCEVELLVSMGPFVLDLYLYTSVVLLEDQKGRKQDSGSLVNLIHPVASILLICSINVFLVLADNIIIQKRDKLLVKYIQ